MRKRHTRRRMSMTSLIDVIFLLLLFFMLTSTFSKFSDVELAAAGPQGGAGASSEVPQFLQLSQDAVQLNTQTMTLDQLGAALRALKADQEDLPLIVALKGDVKAQRLTDLLVVVNGVAGVRPTLLGGS